jgi:hypothetical protein
MKKLLIAAAIASLLLAAALYVRYAIHAPAQAAARYLAAINGLTVGKTTEAELLTRNEFQTLDRNCLQGICAYLMDTDNAFLRLLHLAPRTTFSAMVTVRDGIVIGVVVFETKSGLRAISLVQMSEMPFWCGASPCVSQLPPHVVRAAGISVMISNDSSIRNHLQEAVNSACLSRIRGCSSYADLMPVTKQLNVNLEAEK